MAERVLRFTRTERAVHWVQAASFLLLLVTGFALSLPVVEGILGHRDVLREIHLAAAFFLFFGPAIVALAGDRASVARDVRAVEVWDEDDLRWFVPPPLRDSVPQGRFNAGQKLNAIFVAWSTLAFTITGLVMWQNRRFPLDVVQRANVIHTDLAYIALIAFLGHLYLATIHPATRHSFRAITAGWVERGWARSHHARWMDISPSLPVTGRQATLTAVRVVLGAVIALFAVRLLFFYLGANVTDMVTSWLYDLTAWPGVAGVVPHTGVRVADWPAVPYLVAAMLAWHLAQRARPNEAPPARAEKTAAGLEVTEAR